MPASSEAIVIRMSKHAVQRLDAAARGRGVKRSEFVRGILESNLNETMNLAEEARRQSLLISRRESERDAMSFIASAMSTDGWE